jgi:hypothetical protein
MGILVCEPVCLRKIVRLILRLFRKYNDHFRTSVQRICACLTIRTWISDKTCLSKAEMINQLGGESSSPAYDTAKLNRASVDPDSSRLQITTEDYLFSLLSLVSELVSLLLNRQSSEN